MYNVLKRNKQLIRVLIFLLQQGKYTLISPDLICAMLPNTARVGPAAQHSTSGEHDVAPNNNVA